MPRDHDEIYHAAKVFTERQEQVRRDRWQHWLSTQKDDPCPVCGGSGFITHYDSVEWWGAMVSMPTTEACECWVSAQRCPRGCPKGSLEWNTAEDEAHCLNCGWDSTSTAPDGGHDTTPRYQPPADGPGDDYEGRLARA